MDKACDLRLCEDVHTYSPPVQPNVLRKKGYFVAYVLCKDDSYFQYKP